MSTRQTRSYLKRCVLLAEQHPDWTLAEIQTAAMERFTLDKNPTAVALGRLGGLANKGIPKPRSAENGKLGGRPRKKKVTA